MPGLLASAIVTRGISDWKMHLQHLSANAPDPVNVDALQWAGAQQALDPAKLAWGNPELESLHWEELLPHGGHRLAGGDDVLYDVPDSALTEYPVWLVRVASTGPTSSQRGVAQLVPTTGITPARKLTWGEIKAKYR
jgi:hypothetical protein